MSDVERIWRCGTKGCNGTTSGIYCDPCRVTRPVAVAAPFAEGETVTFDYRGTTKTGTVERVGRVNAVVLIEVNDGQKQKLVRVAFELLKGRAA